MMSRASFDFPMWKPAHWNSRMQFQSAHDPTPSRSKAPIERVAWSPARVDTNICHPRHIFPPSGEGFAVILEHSVAEPESAQRSVPCRGTSVEVPLPIMILYSLSHAILGCWMAAMRLLEPQERPVPEQRRRGVGRRLGGLGSGYFVLVP
jgi:hypothetical protein